MKESIITVANSGCIFRETFNSEYDVRRNGGIPTNVIFNNGVAKFNGTSSKIKFHNIIGNNRQFSIRIRFKLNAIGSVKYIFTNYNTSGGMYIRFETSGQLSIRFQGGGDDTTSVLTVNTWYEYIATYNGSIRKHYLNTNLEDTRSTTYNYNVGNTWIGCNNGVSEFANIDLELFEVYNYALTDTEIYNLYNNKTNKELTNSNNITCLLNYNSLQGYSFDSIGNTLTETNISYPQVGQVTSANFDGSTSKIDCGSDFIGAKTILVMGWIKSYGNTYPSGKVCGNGAFCLWLNDSGTSYFTRNNAATPNMGFTTKKNKWIFFALLNEGISPYQWSSFYGDVNTKVVQIASGTHIAPTSATEMFHIGKCTNITGTQYYRGNIAILRVENFSSYDSILATQRITQFWSNTRKYFN